MAVGDQRFQRYGNRSGRVDHHEGLRILPPGGTGYPMPIVVILDVFFLLPVKIVTSSLGIMAGYHLPVITGDPVHSYLALYDSDRINVGDSFKLTHLPNRSESIVLENPSADKSHENEEPTEKALKEPLNRPALTFVWCRGFVNEGTFSDLIALPDWFALNDNQCAILRNRVIHGLAGILVGDGNRLFPACHWTE